MLTLRQKTFADEYLISGNAEQAAVKAGYSERYARGNAHKLVANSGIKEYIEERLKEIESSRIADAAEVMQYLTSVMRNETKEEVPVATALGIQMVEKDTSIKDRNKAAEMLAKRFGILTDKVSLEVAPIVIKDDVNEHS